MYASTAAATAKLPLSLLEQIPGQVPPPGQVPDFFDPPNLITTIAVVLAISPLFVIVAVGLRIYSKISSARSFTWDGCEYYPSA